MPASSEPVIARNQEQQLEQNRGGQPKTESVLQEINAPQLSPKDYLSRLPPELLTEIFELVRLENGGWHTRAGIARYLLYYTEVNLYQQVRITSLASLKLLGRTLGVGEDAQRESRAEYLSSLIHEFTMNFDCSEEWEEGWGDFDGVGFFGALSSVRDVKIAFCPPLITAITSYDCAANYLEHLTYLKLEGNFRDENPFLMERYVHLRQYVNLDTLELSFYEWKSYEPEETALLPLVENMPTNFTFPLGKLKIGMDFDNTGNQSLATFLAFFANLEWLSVEDNCDDLHFGQVLSKVTRNLLHLTLDREVNWLRREMLGFDEALSRFTSLQSLTLKNAFADQTTVVAVQCCKLLRLLHIVSDNEHPWPISTLKDLLHPHARPSGWKELKLDGGSTGREGNDLRNIEEFPKNNKTRRKENWRLPSWKKDFTFKQAKEFVKMALENGVTVTGDLAENIRIQRKWCRLKARHAKRKAAKEGTGNEGGVGSVA